MAFRTNKIGGTSFDAILLTSIKLVTAVIGLVITRILSEYLSVHAYGTYSQILLLVSSVSAITILGMEDGANYFYCRENDVDKREAYTATILALQCTIGCAAGCLVIFFAIPLCKYFESPS